PANDTCASAQVLPLNRTVSGSIALATNDYQLAAGSACFTGIGQTTSTAAGGDAVYSFTAPSAGNYSFRAWNAAGSLNLVLYLANSCPLATPGTPVTVTCTSASNRNTTTAGGAEEISCVPLTSGQQVFLFVDELAATAGSSFFVQVEPCTLETEPNDTPAQANAIACPIEGAISPAAEADFYSLGTPASGSRIFAMAEGNAGNSSDFDLRVTTATDTLEYDDANLDVVFGSLAPVIAGAPATGVATFLRVSHFSAATISEPYRLFSVVQPPIASATAESEPNGTTATANSAVNNYFSGTLSGPAPSTDVDFFAFSATAGDLIFIALDSDPLRDATPINAALALFDAAGTQIIAVNDGGSTSSTTTGAGSLTATTPNSPAEGIAYRVPTTGNYFVRVMIGTTSTG